MTSKLRAQNHVGPPAPPAAPPADRARRIYRLSPRWAVAVNWKLLSALALALLVWALIVAVLLAV